MILIYLLSMFILLILISHYINKKSLLFIIPDYHCSFILKDEFIKLGYKCHIYVPFWYDPQLLFNSQDCYHYKTKPKTILGLRLKNWGYFIFFLLKGYRYYFVYAGHNIMPLFKKL